MHVCKKCGKEFEGSFCPACGEKWTDATVCPKCGGKLEEGARFCPVCGYSLNDEAPAPSPAPAASAPMDPVKAGKVRTYKILYYMPYFVTCVVCVLFFAWYALPTYTDPFGIFSGASVYDLFSVMMHGGGSESSITAYIMSYLLLGLTGICTIVVIATTVRAFTNPTVKGVKPVNVVTAGIVVCVANLIYMSYRAVENSKAGMANGGCIIASLLFACLFIVSSIVLLLVAKNYKKKNIAYLSDVKIERE